jgi:hypothetical protein
MKRHPILLFSGLVAFTLSIAPYPLLGTQVKTDDHGMMAQTATPVARPGKNCLTSKPTPFPPDLIPWFDFVSTTELWMDLIESGSTDTFTAFPVQFCPFEKPIRFLMFSHGYLPDRSQRSGMGRFLSFEETIRCFRSGFSGNSTRITRTINRIRVEIFKLNAAKRAQENCVFLLRENLGVVVFWYKAPYGFALIDVTNDHLRAGLVEKFVASFKFKKQPIPEPR